jgi:hypothetical protein
VNWHWIILLYASYHAANILIAKWNVHTVFTRMANGNPKQIEHFWYFAGYCLICAPQVYLVNLWLAGSVLCLHGSIFPVAYNCYRGLAPFNLSKISKSKYDKLLVRIGFKDMEAPCIIAELASLILFTFSLFAN